MRQAGSRLIARPPVRMAHRDCPDVVTPRQLALAALCLVLLVVAFCGAVAIGWAYIGTPAS